MNKRELISETNRNRRIINCALIVRVRNRKKEKQKREKHRVIGHYNSKTSKNQTLPHTMCAST